MAAPRASLLRPLRTFRPATIPVTRLALSQRLVHTNANQVDENRGDSKPDANKNPMRGANQDTPNTDPQSSASDAEHLSGDDHPAKQPDSQQEPDRKTGFEGKEGVKGGKEGLDEKTTTMHQEPHRGAMGD